MQYGEQSPASQSKFRFVTAAAARCGANGANGGGGGGGGGFYRVTHTQ